MCLVGIFIVYLRRNNTPYIMENEVVKLVVETGCETISPMVDSLAQSSREMLSATRISASFAMFAFLLVAIVSCASFFVLFITKIGLRERIIATAPKLVSELFACDFCLSWWTGLFLSAVAAAVMSNWLVLAIAVIAAPITRRLVA